MRLPALVALGLSLALCACTETARTAAAPQVAAAPSPTATPPVTGATRSKEEMEAENAWLTRRDAAQHY
jgi:hypothetical protein